jgi:apolipoprotein N-acyltransferase
VLYIIFSAFLFILAQLDLPASGVCVFIWLLPLVVQSRQKKLKFCYGFLWGLLVFGFHLSWLLAMLFEHGVTSQGLVVWIITVIWFSSISGVWFWTANYSWILSTLLFFLFVTRLSLLPYGKMEGYPLINPLLPLFSRVPSSDLKIADLKIDDMIAVQAWWYGNLNPMFVGYRMLDSIAQCQVQYPNIKIIIMPESTFCFDLHEYENFFPIWSDGFQGGTILFGSHRKCGIGFLNSVFALRDGKIIKMYDKQHLMPFVEQIPGIFCLLGCGDLFLKNNEKVEAELTDDIFVLRETAYQVFVCSELFFQTKKVKGLPIIFLWNDSWLQFAWTKKLALNFIYYFSFKHGIAVIHASTQGTTNLRCLKKM